MIITKPTEIKELRKNYDLLIGWGNSRIEFERRYNPTMYKLDYMINGKADNAGEIICGMEIQSPDILKYIPTDKKILIIIFPNIENRIIEQASHILPNADTIIHRLIICDSISREKENFSSDCEDLIIVDLIKKMGANKELTYMDIGVCHPVIRNNTYMLYNLGYYNGILVEPNPEMSELSKLYRPLNKILNIGAGESDSVLPYISGNQPGLNHFMRENEVIDKSKQGIINIPVKNINDIISENFETFPDIIDIDTEGMDFRLLKTLDTEKFPVKIICAEFSHSHDIRKLMTDKGYIHYMSTRENMIFINKKAFQLLARGE